MSGPYRFQADSARTPLDRRTQNSLPAQPVSFKTNVNRMKTKKWVEAKKNAYDGDDWGDYDEYDEYGASEQDPPSASAQYAAPQAQAYGQRFDQPGRSFTDPQRPGQPQLGRRNSFEAGEEQRTFSASTGQPPQGFPGQHVHQPPQPLQTQFVHPALRQGSGAQSDTSDTPEHRRDFSPSAMPPPLQTRISSPPGSVSGSPSARFPPRKSSIGQTDSPVATSPRDRAPSNPGKALPFIRPADIYKRYEEDRERERTSLDEQRQRVETAPGENPVLPPVEEGISDFDSELRSVVDNAFTRADDQRSVPPTPISKSDSGVSRSNTNSTSGISPIMSRVPSSAASAVKARNLAGGDFSTPVIAEEASESGTPVVSRPTSAALLGSTHQIPRKASPGHSRNVSNTSLPGSGLTTPNAAGSPARSPAIKPQAHFPEPETAELSSLSHPSDDMKVSSPTDATTREADIAEAMKTSPVEAHAGLSAAEKESQDAFLESHQASTSVAEAFPRSRSESPSKGRVQELAGKFGDVSQSRRGSTQSNASRTSVQSWEKSQDNSRPSSPTKASSPSRENLTARPPAEREASFRPKLPGQWESYATSAPSPSKELSIENLPATNNNLKSPLEEVDLMPTTAKHPVAPVEPSKLDANAPLGQTRGGVLPRPLQLHREESSSTIPPTPPAKDTPESDEMPPPPPLKEKSPEPGSTTTSSVLPERPIMLPQLSTDEAADDQESDRLRKEIVASLSPQQTQTNFTPEQNPASPHAGSDAQARPNASDSSNSITTNPLTQSPVDATKPAFMTRFSWEGGGSGLLSDRLQQTPTAPPEPIIQEEREEKIPLPTVEKAAEEQEISQFPESYFGPTHSVAVVKSEPISDAGLNARSPPADLPSPSTDTLQPDADRPRSPAPGLHVVNSALNPEAVDIPPRLSREVSPMSEQLRSGQDTPTKESHDHSHDPMQAPVVSPAISAPIHGVQEPTASSPNATVSPTSDKPLGFKDILQIKSPAERISGYNKTRSYWAHADHGLGDWVNTVLSTNPDLATQPYPQPRPTLSTSGTMRHRPTGSISLFGKHHGAGSTQAELAGAPTAQTPVTPTAAPTFPGSGKSASHQMQVRGKDLLHTAGALSGKGLTGAKGLFAKGKSRFKSDKASESEPSSSRETSEEPSDIGSTASDFDTLGRLSLDMTESVNQEKKQRRRFSSPFHRSGRSRSHPGSIVLPSIESTPRSTSGHSRPQSYHPPEAWGAGPHALSTTPPARELLTPERLGVLPSPAKSAFSLFPQDGDVPPVPPIPEALDSSFSEHVTPRLLQSVIRNSTPPAVETKTLEERSSFVEPPASRTYRLEEDVAVGRRELLDDESELLEEGDVVESVEEDATIAPAMEVRRDEDSHDALPPQLHHDDSTLDDDWVQIQAISCSNSESKGEISLQPQREPISPTGARQQTPWDDQMSDGESALSDSHLEERQGPLLRHRSVSPNDAPVRHDTNSVEGIEQPVADDSDDDLPPQLHHDPIPVKGPQIALDWEADAVAGAAPIDLEMSPTLSPVKPHRLNSHEGDGQPYLQQLLNAHPQRPALDISPMLPPAKPVSDISDNSDDEQATPLASAMNAPGGGRFLYETELIGGDLSPISSHASSDEERTPTEPDVHSSHTVDAIATSMAVTVVDTAQSPRDKAATGEDALKTTPRSKPQQQQQLSAYRVVHAVEYLHSQSSLESWEHESTATLSQSDGSPRLDEHDEAEVPSVPLVSDLSLDNVVVRAEEAHNASSKDKPALLSGRDSPEPVAPIKSDTPQEDPQQSPPVGLAGAHKRSESLLSKISSMVSADDASLSPVSSYGPRSRPPSSAAGRQRQIPSAKASPIPVQIKEEPTAPDHVNSSIDNDDFDLYADHNGVVKDEEGRLLRVTTDQPPKPAASSRPPTSGASKPTPLSAQMEESSGRYSDERPMSFVWGPRDANGRPQDEINRPGGGTQDQSPPRVPNTRVQRSSHLRIGPMMKQKAQTTGTQPNGRLLEEPSQGELGSKNVSPLSSYRESNKSSPHNNVSPPPVASASPPPSGSPPSTIFERPQLESPKTSNGQPSPPKSPDPRLIQDPRVMMEAQMRGWTPGQPFPQDLRLRPNVPAQTQMQGLPQSPPSAPRNQYEYQQTMARRAMQAPELKSSPPPGMQSSKKDDKFSIPKFSSVFKGLGKSSSNPPHASQPPPQQPMQPAPQQMQQYQNIMHPHPNNVVENERRSISLQSGVSDMIPPQKAPTKERKTSAFGLNRPLSFGQESHNSQDSTRVQVTGSRLDLGYPASPPLSQGIPPQQPLQHVVQTVQNLPRPEDYRASTSEVPGNNGKKKRFSSLGNIFNRTSASGPSFPTKQKMSKEDKKALKAQKHSSAMPLQSVPQGQPWPPQQPVDQRPYGAVQYGPPPVARPFPGMQGVPLQPIQLQTMQQHAVPPVSPRSMQLQSMSPMSPMSPQSMHPHGMHQQYTQAPQGFQHPAQVPHSQFAPPIQQPLGAPEGSAYMDSRQIAQMMQAQRMHEQSRPSTHHSSQIAHPSIPTAPTLPHLAQRPEEPIPPAFNEYFKPDLKIIKPLPPIQPQPEQRNQYHQHPPQPQPTPVVPQPPRNPRSVSAPTTVPSVDQTPYVSQRQVSSPLHEPQYDTPQIPAAYTQVSGAFVSPSLEQGPSRTEDLADARSYNRQYSDPLMQPLSPQVSAMATSPPNLRHNSSDSVVSPISDPSPGPMTGPSPPPNSRPPKQRMTSITEQVQSERPWNLDLPHGATEQEIVRARQRQYMEQQLAAQEQLHAEWTGRSPSPRSGQSQQSASPPPPAPTQAQPPHRGSGGFRELLPRSSPQPYPITEEPESQRSQPEGQRLPSPPIAPAPVHPGQFSSPAGYPLPMSPGPANIRSPVNPVANMMPPPSLPAKIPHTPMNASFSDPLMNGPISQDAASDDTHDSLYDPPPPPTDYQHPAHRGRPEYDDLPPADEPPPYSGPGVPNDGMDKDRPRPPGIVTDRGRLLEPRQRQASLGILQHPQPASMAASPQRSSADMGADILRRQLLQVEQRERTDRLQQAEARRVESEREREERERARARARELERSVSGGGRVGSLRSAQGSTRNGAGGFERGGSTRRAVYELPAEEDDEPVMRATSFPGQEWVPTWTED
ncbi:hypothetical protein P171DRAFT_435084 [Karstenula rhodostoma CBS 690.94]|uniref:SWI-SNF chromatin-remodeling complex protein n=1 Tax=Karstenula rhodostoma CBS 690.94 TaxID=1392251 RepID=A0A9P4PBP6_9PLEO|nr:hypothetical protein P171DRAFT_435084 [Karstenula rhodostoma CBS 690.94]